MARTLLFLSADTIQVYCRTRNGLALLRAFSNDANGREEFSALLQQLRHPLWMLVDVVEEDFQLETLPHLVGSSRRALLKRKLEQSYRSTPFRQATLLRRLDEGRRDDEYVFSALTNPHRILPWLDILRAQHIPLAGIYSVPSLSAAVLKTVKTAHNLLLTYENRAGLRLTYFRGKHLNFSRLIPLNKDDSLIEAIATETPRTQQYLKSLSLLPMGEVLEVYILCHAADQSPLQMRLEDTNDLSYHYLDLNEFALHHNIRYTFSDSDCTPLLLELLARKPPAAHYGSAEHTHFYRLWQWRRMLYALAGGIAVAGALGSVPAYWQAIQLREEVEPIQQQIKNLYAQIQTIQNQFPHTAVSVADMKTAVLLARSLKHYSPPPENILLGLSTVLDDFSRIRLTKLAWQAEAADTIPYPVQVITFDGTLDGLDASHSDLEYIERFQQALEQQGYTVNATTLPRDFGNGSSVNEPADSARQRQFTFRLIWRPPS